MKNDPHGMQVPEKTENSSRTCSTISVDVDIALDLEQFVRFDIDEH
jgi:hypothetical protein